MIRLHDTRHTYATLALQAGGPVKTVSERLGHTTIMLTLDVYGHVLPDQDEQAADLFYAHVYGAASEQNVCILRIRATHAEPWRP